MRMIFVKTICNFGDRITYYFEIWDNDGLHGAKSTRSLPMQFIVPTIEELQEIKDEQNADLKMQCRVH